MFTRANNGSTEVNTNVVIITGRLTSVSQPLNVWRNLLFKAALKEMQMYTLWVSDGNHA